MSRPRSYIWLAVIPLLLFAAWLSARSLNIDALWIDEIYSIYESGGAYFGPLSPLDIAFRVSASSTWPPIYNFTLAGWGAVAGWSPLAGRALSWLLGLLSIAIIYRLAREMLPQKPWFAFFAAVFMSGSAFYLYYLHELRGYTLHILIGCSTATLYWRALRKPGRHLTYGLALTLVLLLYSHPFGQIWFAVQAGFHLLFQRRHPGWKRLILPFVIAGSIYLPWVLVILKYVSLELSAPRGLSVEMILTAASAAFTNWLLLIVAILSTLALRRWRKKPIQYLWWWLLGGTAITLIINHFVPFLFHIRLMMAILPPLLLLPAAGLLELKRWRWLQVTVCILWLVMGIYLSNNAEFAQNLPGTIPSISRPGFEAAIEVINERATADDAILFRLEDASIEDWLSAPLHYYFFGTPLHISLLSTVDEENDASFEQRLSNFVGNAPWVWVAAVPDKAAGEQITALAELLNSRYIRCEIPVDMPDMRLEMYAQHQCP
ncbi:MAG: glycosyltransferase family 39 protein [Anaerolineae bacterium]|nr:glycosyltransferase family 39 protein [Anaerolineae bacterium]